MLVAVREVAVTFAGAVGACASGQADVEPVNDAFADRFPAASYASTSNGYAVPQLNPETAAFVCVVVDPATPLRYRRYPATPTLSVLVSQASETLVPVAPESRKFPGCDGLVVSEGVGGGAGAGGAGAEHAFVTTLSWPGAELFPAASRATTPYA